MIGYTVIPQHTTAVCKICERVIKYPTGIRDTSGHAMHEECLQRVRLQAINRNAHNEAADREAYKRLYAK